MAETPPLNEALLREVDDAVRQDWLLDIWNRFGRWIVGLVVAGLVAFGGWLYWTHHSRQKSGEIAEQAQKVIETAGRGGTPDTKELEALAQASQPGYRAMAMLVRAGVAAQNDDIGSAANIYGKIAADDDLPQPYRDLATVRQVALQFDQLPPAQVIARLKPLAVEGAPWFGSAGEMTAIAYMKMGRKDMAATLFAAIAKDDKAPQTLRSRARQMAGLLGVDAVDTEEDRNGKDELGNAATGE